MFYTVTQEEEVVGVTRAIYEVCMRHLLGNAYKQ